MCVKSFIDSFLSNFGDTFPNAFRQVMAKLLCLNFISPVAENKIIEIELGKMRLQVLYKLSLETEYDFGCLAS